MTETGVGHLGLSGFGIFAIVVGSLSLTVLAAILVRRRKSPLAFVVTRSTAMRAVPFVVGTWLVLAAGCAAAASTTVLPAGGPPKIPHVLEGREGQCLACHEAGVVGAPKIPAKHAGRTGDMCPLCHVPAGASAPMLATAPAHSPGVKPISSTAGGPPQIPHSLEGRNQCLMCHEAGVAGAPKVPASHAGRTSDMCPACHRPSAAGR